MTVFASDSHDTSPYGEYSDEVVVDVNGESRHVTIFHQYVDDVWSEYTAVLDDGTVMSRNRSLRHLLLDDSEDVEEEAPVSISY